MKQKIFANRQIEFNEKITLAKKVKYPVYYLKTKLWGHEFYLNEKYKIVLDKSQAFKTLDKHTITCKLNK